MADDSLADPPATLATLDPDALDSAEIAAAVRFAEAAKAANTRRAYASDWAVSAAGRPPAVSAASCSRAALFCTSSTGNFSSINFEFERQSRGVLRQELKGLNLPNNWALCRRRWD